MALAWAFRMAHAAVMFAAVQTKQDLVLPAPQAFMPSVFALPPLLRAAALAPLLGNSRPWQLRASSGYRVIELYARPCDEVRRADPQGRGVHVASGMVLFNLRIAALASGHEPVARLLPSREDPLLLASVRLAGPHRTRRPERLLHDALGAVSQALAGTAQRSRGNYGAHAVPARVLDELAGAAAVEGATLDILDPAVVSGVVTMAAPDGARLGVVSMPHPERGTAVRVGWLRAGQAAQRVLLLASTHRIRVIPLTRACTEPGTRLTAALARHSIRQPLVVFLLAAATERDGSRDKDPGPT